ncbi:MAG TPA: gamma-glutamylcyclotransferase [Clostridiales bacterium]|jgi:gamma-glutamylcyclotransferase (GGCT)/AIG2-like uncharacterized protein YtfP|nr:gamma-glutamylcyclotransferase [Clostridiales bacterium]
MKELLMNKAAPSREAFQDFEKQMKDWLELFQSQVKGTADIEEVTGMINELIKNQDADGYWRVIFSEDMPYDAKVHFWKYPTILFTGLLINFYMGNPDQCVHIQGLEAALIRALDIIEKGGIAGHGFSSFRFMMDALNLLVEAGAMQFIGLYPAKHQGFTQFLLEKKKELELMLAEGKTKFDFNEEFGMRIERLIHKMNGEKKIWLFVYGTLMKMNGPQGYLEESEFRGTAALSGYALYDLGRYPGIVEDKEETVKGELYCIPQKKIGEIDAYEAEGYLYAREKVRVSARSGESIEAYTYVYKKPVDGKRMIPFSFQPWYLGISDIFDHYVWYACYGSNINYERFMKYIEMCEDNSPPLQIRPRKLNHPIYFAKQSGSWQNQGVAFLDLSKKGSSYGKMYLITKEQLAEIQRHEGRTWYNKKALLGWEDGLPIYTLTHKPRWEQDTVPSQEYLDVIKQGIKDTYQLSDSAIDNYLWRKILRKEQRAVLMFLRQQEHGVSIQAITDGLETTMEDILADIGKLRDLGLIKQDGRSVRAGVSWNGKEAVYYTVKKHRAMIDRILNR